jgi:hypothetical protein
MQILHIPNFTDIVHFCFIYNRANSKNKIKKRGKKRERERESESKRKQQQQSTFSKRTVCLKQAKLKKKKKKEKTIYLESIMFHKLCSGLFSPAFCTHSTQTANILQWKNHFILEALLVHVYLYNFICS